MKRGLTIEQAAQDTRISRKFLEAIESEDFNALPAPVYVRGFLRSYANYLRIDPSPLLEQVAEVLDRPISGPDSFVGGPRQGKGGNRGTSDPWRRRGVAPQPNRPPDRMPPSPPPNQAEVEPEEVEEWEEVAPEIDDSVRARNLRLRESFGDAANVERPRGVVPNPPPPSQFREQRIRREPIGVPPPPLRQPFPPRPRSEPEYEEPAAEDDEYYEDDDAGAPPTRYVPPMAGFDPGEEDMVAARGARRREAGVMRERGAAAAGGGIPPLLIAVAGASFVILVAAALVFGLFRTNNDDDDPGGVIQETPTVTIQTSVVVGSPTVKPTGSPSASVTGTISATVSGTPGTPTTGTPATGTPRPTATPGGTATSTPTPAEPTATPTPSVEPTATAVPATPTPTLGPPTPTPVPPTATPVPPPHAFGYGECAGGNCGNPPLLVICAPDGWFVDVGANYANPGWPTRSVTKAGDASSACP